MSEVVPFNRRIYGIVRAQPGGLYKLELSVKPPDDMSDVTAVLLLRGMLHGVDRMDVPLGLVDEH